MKGFDGLIFEKAVNRRKDLLFFSGNIVGKALNLCEVKIAEAINKSICDL